MFGSIAELVAWCDHRNLPVLNVWGPGDHGHPALCFSLVSCAQRFLQKSNDNGMQNSHKNDEETQSGHNRHRLSKNRHEMTKKRQNYEKQILTIRLRLTKKKEYDVFFLVIFPISVHKLKHCAYLVKYVNSPSSLQNLTSAPCCCRLLSTVFQVRGNSSPTSQIFVHYCQYCCLSESLMSGWSVLPEAGNGWKIYLQTHTSDKYKCNVPFLHKGSK